MSGLQGAATLRRCTACKRPATVQCDIPVERRYLERGAALVQEPCGAACCDQHKATTDVDGVRVDLCARHGAGWSRNEAVAAAALVSTTRQAVERNVGELYAGDPELERAQRHHENHLRRAGAELPDIEIPDVFATEEA